MLPLLLTAAIGFDASKFKTRCAESSFCTAYRPGDSRASVRPPPPFELLPGTLRLVGLADEARVAAIQPTLGPNSTILLRLRPIRSSCRLCTPCM